MINLGLRPNQLARIKPADWWFNGFTPVKLGSQNELGDWEAYLPEVEYQNLGNFDRMNCVTYSLLNCFETLYYYQTGIKRNFSDRFIAKLSNTTKDGNWLDTVFDTARQVGLIDEERWPDSLISWDDYYKPIPQDIVDEGKEFSDNWSIYREWINTSNDADIVKALESSPLQATVKFATGNNILYPQGAPNHAVEIYHAELGQWWEIYDDYSQTKKRYHWDYPFGVILKPTLIKKTNMFIPQDNQLYCLVQGSTQILCMGYQGKLMIYDEKIDTFLNASMRSNKLLLPIPITLDQYNSVDKVNGKNEPI